MTTDPLTDRVVVVTGALRASAALRALELLPRFHTDIVQVA
jgi:hypothetical protein